MTMDVGLAGLGHMGLPMATRLAGHGFPLTVWNRTASRAAPLADRDVRVAGSPGELVVASDVIITMLADGAAARAVWCGPDGLLAGCRAGCVAVDMSTIGPNAARAGCTEGFADADFACVAALLQGEHGGESDVRMLSSN
jgi:3-hydroxyisobutyrate dehydrogenase-like beta-hydroxyacid dehydrogenase